MQLNLSFPPSFPSNVAWHPPLIRKARTRCDLCRALHDFAWLRLTSQCLPSGNYGWRVWTQRGWLPIINLLIYERRPWNAHGQHSWTPWHHWLQHQDYQIQRRIRQRWETQRHPYNVDRCPKMSSGTDLRYCTRALRSFTRNALKWSCTSSTISVRNAWRHGVHGLTLSKKVTHFRISWSEASCTWHGRESLLQASPESVTVRLQASSE